MTEVEVAERAGEFVGIVIGYSLFCLSITWIIMKFFKDKEKLTWACLISFIIMIFLADSDDVTNSIEKNKFISMFLLAIAQFLTFLIFKDRYKNKEIKENNKTVEQTKKTSP